MWWRVPLYIVIAVNAVVCVVAFNKYMDKED